MVINCSISAHRAKFDEAHEGWYTTANCKGSVEIKLAFSKNQVIANSIVSFCPF